MQGVVRWRALLTVQRSKRPVPRGGRLGRAPPCCVLDERRKGEELKPACKIRALPAVIRHRQGGWPDREKCHACNFSKVVI